MIIFNLMNIPDNSKLEQMVKNHPPAGILPAVNKRLLAQYFGRNVFGVTAFAALGWIFLYKLDLNLNSGPVLKSRKSYSFEGDPFSGKVRCSYR